MNVQRSRPWRSIVVVTALATAGLTQLGTAALAMPTTAVPAHSLLATGNVEAQDGFLEQDPVSSDPGGELPGSQEPGTEEPSPQDPGNQDPGSRDPGVEDPSDSEPDAGEMPSNIREMFTKLLTMLMQALADSGFNPFEPAEPADPAEPETPVDPVNPGDPRDPGDPSNPVRPVDPGEPNTPGNGDEEPETRAFQGETETHQHGSVQVEIEVSGEKITSVRAVKVPDGDPTSKEISKKAIPKLMQSAMTNQSADIDMVSGASLTSEAFKESLASAILKAGL